ncbi:hypothetical protein HanRHA438_Chr02g0052521 [Helianthus annuus]|nr:hypothetical protein HanRHA438_Chr02g0052521 [Helianthus annuus]
MPFMANKVRSTSISHITSSTTSPPPPTATTTASIHVPTRIRTIRRIPRTINIIRLVKSTTINPCSR